MRLCHFGHRLVDLATRHPADEPGNEVHEKAPLDVVMEIPCLPFEPASFLPVPIVRGGHCLQPCIRSLHDPKAEMIHKGQFPGSLFHDRPVELCQDFVRPVLPGSDRSQGRVLGCGQVAELVDAIKAQAAGDVLEVFERWTQADVSGDRYREGILAKVAQAVKVVRKTVRV